MLKENIQIKENNELTIDDKLKDLLQDIKESNETFDDITQDDINQTLEFLNNHHLETKEDIIDYFYNQKIDQDDSALHKKRLGLLPLALFMGLSGGLEANVDYLATHPRDFVPQTEQVQVVDTKDALNQETFTEQFDNFMVTIKNNNLDNVSVDDLDIKLSPLTMSTPHEEYKPYSEAEHVIDIVNGTIDGIAQVDPGEKTAQFVEDEPEYEEDGGPDPHASSLDEMIRGAIDNVDSDYLVLDEPSEALDADDANHPNEDGFSEDTVIEPDEMPDVDDANHPNEESFSEDTVIETNETPDVDETYPNEEVFTEDVLDESAETYDTDENFSSDEYASEIDE